MFTYKAIDLNITTSDIDLITKEVKSIPDKHWFFNEYRNCDIVNLYHKDFVWTEAGKLCTHLINVYNKKIKPITSISGINTETRSLPDALGLFFTISFARGNK